MKRGNLEKGITLIALVITIIVLLILAGVTLSIVFNGGIIDKSQNAVDKWEASQKNETEKLNYIDSKLDKIIYKTQIFNGNNLSLWGNGEKDEVIILKPGSIQYGPHITIQPGEYQVTYIGNNLNLDTTKYSLTSNSGEKTHTIDEIQVCESNELAYTFTTSETLVRFEMKLSNNTTENITIERIELRKLK